MGSYILDHVWISVFVTIAGYVECLGGRKDTGVLAFTGLNYCESGTKYDL